MSSEQIIEQLKSHIHSLEDRVHQLEGKYGKPDTGSKSAVDGMRMILIGPPGAGKYLAATAQWQLRC
jgi:adenylate kinase